MDRAVFALVSIALVAAAAAAGAPPDAVVADWAAQDGIGSPDRASPKTVAAVLRELGDQGTDLRARLDAGETPVRQLYLEACERRRRARLAPHLETLRRVVFTKHYDLGGSHYAYTEGQSDAQRERHFKPGSSLCLLQMDGLYGSTVALLDDPKGVIRDPDVSYDGRRVLFAWKKSLDEDDYHLYEMTVADRKVRQLTFGLGFADYEGVYLPDGHIVFNSTRCVQTVDCWWTEVSNLYTCDPQGRYLRRLSFDQVHTNYPQVTPDGRVIYTRWDYSDRGQIYPQGLFQMFPDGTGQTELYGNNSWFPTTILHARAIPDTRRYVAIFTGHHTRQQGWLGIVDPALGRQENAGAQLIAPVRDTPAVHVDRYGQSGDQFQYPYPLGETAFLVALRPQHGQHFAIYFVTADGRRELLAADPRISCNQPVPLAPRPKPHQRPNVVDYRKNRGNVYLQDIYAGPGLEGVARGTVAELRVVALEFRAAGIGSNRNRGPAGRALVSTPVSIEGCWDVKRVLGTATVHDDGSACFTVPARTPLYFQALDARGHAVQTMRSWLTLQPGESVSCVGCHESKNTTPPVLPPSQALRGGPQALEAPPWGTDGFSFPRLVQPILDRHCVRCHHLDTPPRYNEPERRAGKAYDPRTMPTIVPWGAVPWRATTSRPPDGWAEPAFDDSAWQRATGGFGTKRTPGAKVGTAWATKDIWLRRSFALERLPAAPAFLCHHDEDVEIYLNGVLAASARGHTKRYELIPMTGDGLRALKEGKNLLAVHCRQTRGGQFIDVGIVETPEAGSAGRPEAPRGVEPAFSLEGDQAFDSGARKAWSTAYKALARRAVADWISPQSAPPMLPPHHAGAATSRLVAMLEEGHRGVELSPRELRTIAAWIDLLVPYCGDYMETMRPQDAARYRHFLDKRRRWETQEAANIRAFLADRPPPR
ncbi:MAG: hypothetical protein ACLF0G_02630 [Candidatus Brocadiia bacterium]